MKSITKYLFENISLKSSDNLLFEAFKSSYMHDLDAAFRKKYEEYTNANDFFVSLYGRYTKIQKVLKGVGGIRYDKITDEMFNTYEGEKQIKRALSIIRKFLKHDKHGIVIGYVDKDVKSMMINGCILLFDLNDKYVTRKSVKTQYEGLAYFNYCTKIAIFELENHPDIEIKYNDSDSRDSRMKSREGMIYQGDADFYKKLIDETHQRYSKIIMSQKLNTAPLKDAKKKLSEIIDDIQKLNTKVSSDVNILVTDPSFYVKYEKIQNLTFGENGITSFIRDMEQNINNIKNETGSTLDEIHINELKDFINKHYTQIRDLLDSLL